MERDKCENDHHREKHEPKSGALDAAWPEVTVKHELQTYVAKVVFLPVSEANERTNQTYRRKQLLSWKKTKAREDKQDERVNGYEVNPKIPAAEERTARQSRPSHEQSPERGNAELYL